MALQKEQLVLIVTVGVLGWLAWSSTKRAAPLDSSRRKGQPELVAHAVPDVALVRPQPRGSPGADARELFAPPSDTRPLPPLDFQPPPLAALPALRPPAEPGPAPELFGRFLRVQPVAIDVPGLFETALAPAEEAAAAPARPTKELTQQERLERQAAWRRLYDWYRSGEFHFGRIVNDDRYRLAKRANEPLAFIEFNPETGQPRLPGQPPVQVARANVAEFGFAETVQNRIELARIEYGDPLPASQYDQALFFAQSCLDERHATPRALEVAEEIYARAAAALKDDPAPRLGLARVYEAGFQFEKAFAEYRRMLDGTWGRSALVQARLAELEARLRLFEQAEERLREAERAGRTLWPVQAALGRFLLARGRAGEALEPLRLANQYEPTHPDAKRERAELRCDLAAALVASGSLPEAGQWFEKARTADPSSTRAIAGLAALSALQGGGTNGSAAAPAEGPANFELLLAHGIQAVQTRSADIARVAAGYLLAAAEADPVRAGLAWRALSYLAETTGNPEDAQRFIDLAYENDPTDVYTLFQRGRVLAARDDLDGAAAMFRRALDRELDFPDALAQLGELMHKQGQFAAADKYLERAVLLDARFVPAIALRGLNFIELGDLRGAEATLQQALAIDPEHPTARNALAWVHYLKGGEANAIEAQTRLRELDDARRALPEGDPHRVWARAQIARIGDHVEKFVWSDRFDRKDLRNGWDTEEKLGPLFAIHDGVVTLSGAFKSNGRARLWQSRASPSFVALEARVTVRKETSAKIGLFVSRETVRAGESQVEAEIALARPNDPGRNGLQWRAMKRGEEELPWTDVPGFEWKFDQSVTLRIERSGDAADARIRVLFDGLPIVENKSFPSLGRTTGNLFLGLFAEGQTGRQVALDIEDVEITYREKK